jgi:hypothetical protein
MTETDRSEQ